GKERTSSELPQSEERDAQILLNRMPWQSELPKNPCTSNQKKGQNRAPSKAQTTLHQEDSYADWSCRARSGYMPEAAQLLAPSSRLHFSALPRRVAEILRRSGKTAEPRYKSRWEVRREKCNPAQ